MDGGSKNIDNVLPVSPEQPAPDETPKEVPETNQSASDRVLLSWNGESFDYAEKGVIWYMAAAAIILAIIGYFVWQRDWFSVGITVVVSAVLFWYVATARPKSVNYAITSFGIQVGERFYPFSDIHSFWLNYTPKVQKLNFVFTKKYLPTLVVDISNTEAQKVKIILSRKIPEQPGRTENILDRVIRALKL